MLEKEKEIVVVDVLYHLKLKLTNESGLRLICLDLTLKNKGQGQLCCL